MPIDGHEVRPEPPEIVIEHLSDFIRNCVRALASKDPSYQIAIATRSLASWYKEIAQLEQFHFYDITQTAVMAIRVEDIPEIDEPTSLLLGWD